VAEIIVKIPNWLEKPAVFILLLYRRIRFGYPFRRIPLSRGKFAIVDPEDYSELIKYKWQAEKNRSIFYARRKWRCRKTGKALSVSMHREIMNAPGNLVVDHINFNGLDNRKANLRIATHRQNVCHRRKLDKSSRSRHKGAYWEKGLKRWRASIQINGKRIYLGIFKEEIQAAKAYDNAAKKYHGDFAALNFPKPPKRKRTSIYRF